VDGSGTEVVMAALFTFLLQFLAYIRGDTSLFAWREAFV
jgi:hypothetical protein